MTKIIKNATFVFVKIEVGGRVKIVDVKVKSSPLRVFMFVLNFLTSGVSLLAAFEIEYEKTCSVSDSRVTD